MRLGLHMGWDVLQCQHRLGHHMVVKKFCNVSILSYLEMANFETNEIMEKKITSLKYIVIYNSNWF